MYTRLVFGVLVLVSLGLVLGACGSPSTPAPAAPAPTATPVATPTPPPAATPAATPPMSPTQAPQPTPAPAPSMVQGKQVYTTFCSGCHGAEALGTALAPALPGHSESVVKRQVRSPIGTMPPFSSSIISDEDLGQIADFIASLPTTEQHTEPVDMEGALAMHHWMAIYGLKNGDTQDVMHHIDHILAMVTDHEHERQMEEAKELIAQGKLHDAEHEIGEMLAGQADTGLLNTELHLKLAQAAVGLHDAQDAIHHMEHFLAVAGEAATERADEVLDLLREGDLHEAEHEIVELLEAH